ncbi:MAG: hypothetical protein GJ680_17115 [Alteromonadaceae bacterium]|nr:hypothetical protein [Alteromonadaceae bacterium]
MKRFNSKVALGLTALIFAAVVASCAKTEAGGNTNPTSSKHSESPLEATASLQDGAQEETSSKQNKATPGAHKTANVQLKKSPATGYKISFNDKTYFASTPGLQTGKLVFDPEVQQYANITNKVTLVTSKAKMQALQDMLAKKEIVSGVYKLGDTTLSLRIKNGVEFQGLLQQVKKEFSNTAIEVVLFYSGKEAF